MRLIRLSKAQDKWTKVGDPIFDLKVVLSDKENEKLISQFLNCQTEELRLKLMCANLHLVEHTVGRYLANWPETRRWKDEMVSIGLETLIRQIDKKQPKFFRARTVLRIKAEIEQMLHSMRTSVSASLRTNTRRAKNGEPLACVPEVSLDKIMEKKDA